MLSTGDIRGYDPGGLCLIGEDRRPPIKWTVGGGVAQYVLSPARLAKELRGAALRVDGKAGEWLLWLDAHSCVCGRWSCPSSACV